MSRGCDKKRALLASIKKNILKVNRPQVEINAKAVRHAQKKSDRCPKLLSPFIFLLSSSSFFLSFFPYKDAHERYTKPSSQPARLPDCRPPKLTFVQAVLAGKGEKTVSLFSRSVGGHNEEMWCCVPVPKVRWLLLKTKKKLGGGEHAGSKLPPTFYLGPRQQQQQQLSELGAAAAIAERALSAPEWNNDFSFASFFSSSFLSKIRQKMHGSVTIDTAGKKKTKFSTKCGTIYTYIYTGRTAFVIREICLRHTRAPGMCACMYVSR